MYNKNFLEIDEDRDIRTKYKPIKLNRLSEIEQRLGLF